MKKMKAFAAGAVTVATAITLAACGGGSGSGSATSGSGAGKGIVSVYESEPQNPLIPTDTVEQGGFKVIESMFSGLTYYDAKGNSHNDMAQSITPNSNNTSFDIKIKANQKFSDGEPVNADSFINAWNYGAYGPNAQLANSFFAPIDGYAAMNPTTKGATPTAKTLTGLKKVGDLEFTVTMTNPVGDFPIQLGYTAFDPLPANAFKDMKTFGQNPIGNGPYKLAPSGWQHNTDINLVANGTSAGANGYTGPRQPQNGGIDFKIYTNGQAAYSDIQSGQLDILDQLPTSVLGTYKKDSSLGGYISEPGGIFEAFTIPQWLPVYQGKAGQLRRQAISEAIDRSTITKTIFQGNDTPAKDFTAPVIPGWSASLPGNSVLNFNATDAKAKWAQANALSPLPANYSFSIAYNADGPHQAWVQAVLNSVSQTLGVKTQMTSVPTFGTFQTDAVTPGKFQTPFRSGWMPDYPGAFDYLGAMFMTGAGSNNGDYTNKTFDNLLLQAQAASTQTQANAYFAQAQSLLLQDLPQVPLWYQNTSGVWSTKVSGVQFGYDGNCLFYLVKKN